MKENYAFNLAMKVRDYECDIQGVVNNSVYMNYLEHVRHEFLHFKGLDFAELAKKQINLMVVSAELQYKSSLRSGDEFWVGLNFSAASKVRFQFLQDIYRSSDDKRMLTAVVTGTSVNERGRPYLPDEIKPLMSPGA